MPSASGEGVRRIVRHLSEAGLSFKTIPGIDALVSGETNLAQVRPVNVDDLLRRKRIVLPGDPVRRIFRDRRVMVTGAGGTIAPALVFGTLAGETAAQA